MSKMNDLEIVEKKGYCITQLLFQTAITELNTVMFIELPLDVKNVNGRNYGE